MCGAAALSAGVLFRSGGLSGGGHPGIPVADSGRGLALGHARGTRNPLEVVAQGCGVRSGVLGDEDGACGESQWRARGCGVPAKVWVGFCYWNIYAAWTNLTEA